MASPKLCYIIRSGHPLLNTTFSVYIGFVLSIVFNSDTTSRVGGEGGGRGSKGLNETPLEVNNGGLKTQTVDFQLLANSGGMENKL